MAKSQAHSHSPNDPLGSRYEATHVLSSDDRGSTWIGISRESGQRVLVKSRWLRNLPSGYLMRLQYEASILGKISSQHYSPPLDLFQSSDAVHIVFPYVRGISLEKRLRSHPLNVAETIALGISLCSALRDLHESRVFHRAVRPSNVIVNSGGLVRTGTLVDLGASSPVLFQSQHAESFTHEALYFAPEQAGSIDHDITASADLYSAGVILFECLAAYPPFSGSDVHSVLFSHMTASVPELRSLGLPVPRALDEVIQRLLRKDPRDRYQSAQATLVDLLSIQQGLSAGIDEPKVVIGSSDQRSSLIEPAFVSRDTEISVFDGLLGSAAMGESGLVFLEGESGGGKSRLLAEVAIRAGKKGFRVLKGFGTNRVAQYPFHILDGVVERFVADCRSNESYADHARRTLEQDAGIVSSAFPLLGDVFGAPMSGPTGPEVTGEMRAIRALGSFLSALGSKETPALVILDDCQWADELTYKLIRHWQSQSADGGQSHVLVIAAFRSEEVVPDHLLRQIPASARMELTLFDREEIRQLVESMAGRLPEDALDIIVQLGGGSPFMSSAVLYGLVESGALVFDQKQWRLDPLAVSTVHSSDRDATFLTRRLELLSERVLNYLAAGAVIGNQFDIQMAAFLAELPAAEAIAAVDVARQRQLIWVRPDGVTCVFMHDKIREALFDRQNADSRRALHLRAAHYFQQQDNVRTAELAYHFDAAGASDLAFEHALVSAEGARARHALEVAEQQYEIARRGARWQSPDVQYRVAAGLGDVLMLRGKYDAAGKMLTEADELAATQLTNAQARGKLAELAFKRGDMERAVQDNESALSSLGWRIPRSRLLLVLWLLWEVVVQVAHTFLPKLFVHRDRSEPTESDRLSIRLFSGLAHGCWYCKGSLNTLWAHLRGLNLAERFPPTLELGNAYSEHAPVMSLLGMFSRAVRYAQKSLTIRRDLGDLWGQGQSLHYYGVVLYAASRYSECIQRCRESVRLLERMGDYWQVHVARYQIAAAYYRLGDLGIAIEESRRNHQSGLELGDEQASGIILDVWARAAHGNVPEDLIEMELNRDRHDAQGQAQVLFASAVYQLGKNEIVTACGQLEQAIGIVNRAGVCNSYTLPIAAWAVTAYRRHAESLKSYTPQLRNQLLRKASNTAFLARLACWRCKNDLPHILREQALLYSLKGRRRAALKCITKSLQIAIAQESRYEYAQSMMVKANVGKEFGWTTDATELQKAHTVLAELQISNDTLVLSHMADAPTPSLSLADRFETILESGRKVATGLSESVIYEAICAAASRLLRVQHGVVLRVSLEDSPESWPVLAGRLGWEVNSTLLRESLAASRAIATSGGNGTSRDSSSKGKGNSELSVPLFMRGKPVACLYVMHSEIRGLFGVDEERVADFLATIAGAALENAEGFAELQELNLSLERRVADRTAVVETRSRELATTNKELERIAQELRQAQVQLSASKQAAESASEAKSRFLATMSHEIRTPMNGILGMAELILNSQLTDRQRGYLQTLKDSGKALLTLLNDLLDFSKIEAGKMELESIPFSLRDVVVDSARLLAVPAGRKGLNLITRIQPHVPSHVLGDPNRLRQVIVNLLGNAIKFTPEGEVTIHVGLQSHAQEECLLRISVEDTGIGIPANKQQSIFEAFHQTDSSVTRRFGGTGLGLAISLQLVQLMDGTIQVESEEGRGTSFHVDVPFTLADDPRPIEILETPDRGVLLLSDHRGSLLAARDALAYLGVEAQTEPNRMPREHRPLLIVDLSVDSHRLVSTVTQRIFDGANNPEDIICLVPGGNSELMQECEALDVEQVLTKPVKPQELRQAILAILDCRGEEIIVPESVFGRSESSLRVLVADDSPVNREVAQGLLELCGHIVHTVEDGAEAVREVEDHDYDLVFMDLEMPEMDGLAATRAIRQLPNGKSQIPIYAMTAHALAESDQKCRAAGMDGFVTKPIVPEQLMEVLNRIMVVG